MNKSMSKRIWTVAALTLVLSACKSAPTNTGGTDGDDANQADVNAHAKSATDSWYAPYLSNRQVYFDYDSDTQDYKT